MTGGGRKRREMGRKTKYRVVVGKKRKGARINGKERKRLKK